MQARIVLFFACTEFGLQVSESNSAKILLDLILQAEVATSFRTISMKNIIILHCIPDAAMTFSIYNFTHACSMRSTEVNKTRILSLFITIGPELFGF
jgi:hypothetical protein